MTNGDTREQVLDILKTIAPEVETDEIQDDELLREQVDLDSMDWLSFLRRIHQQLHVDIPESDYSSLETLADVVGYVERKAPITGSS
ncbi:phosphopantetheine-binding protein [Mycobacterium intermedium]|uniref:Phosphopantetheine-binding protein n=1 Tax=Mycobacterium intermedium TaxID=28445 RepID=A0A1E3SCX8_MYCIE|nr:acyl carrier protein [Mycobacterium intermedium]MCV6966548.1 acyl carrier protein [Mycobacterium intermedium]ODQ99931.1 phosphopantetheine-binding protein [Mycobacterium intermedium]OPE49793.1 phosphopantetheine-binding protein [Mycobacterium intermedium]ORB08259.1 phosphopantetheine-binding protein [Mycobacterium intermedium]